jgi:hypothetical protein
MVKAKTPIISATVDGTRVTLYTCPPNCRAKVPLVFIVNANGTVTVTLEIYKAASETRFFILSGKNLSTSEYIQFSEGYIMLEPGDKIEVTPDGTDPVVDALCTVEEQFIANQGL